MLFSILESLSVLSSRNKFVALLSHWSDWRAGHSDWFGIETIGGCAVGATDEDGNTEEVGLIDGIVVNDGERVIDGWYDGASDGCKDGFGFRKKGFYFMLIKMNLHFVQ